MIKIGFIITSLLFLVFSTEAQVFISKTGKVSFYSKAPLEDIEATSNETRSIYNIENGEVVAKVAMKSFHFANPLMEEHFNENYIESDKYPTAVFKGTVYDSSGTKMNNDGKFAMYVNGEMELRNIRKPVQARVIIERSGDQLHVVSEFSIKLEDYDITIPGSVVMNISENISILFEADFDKMENK